MSAAWFIDGAYAMKCWSALNRSDKVDYVKLSEILECKYLDQTTSEKIEDATTSTLIRASDHKAKWRSQCPFNFLHQQFGASVKLYWLQEKQLYWPTHMGGGQLLIQHQGNSQTNIRKPWMSDWHFI